ncbi:MAG: selenium cofactor biosynthesis protein YqeC [Halovenus sp.]|uniref:selenium cofactor biosynthesis protein YqeC n=1 Tax=Halovenus amylolytica TaxID=2500550 RepID=UPI000FE353FE
MDLVTAIGSADGPICVVGAGGKTTTMFALAHRRKRAIVTSTVNIPIFDREVARLDITTEPLATLDTDELQFPLGLVPDRQGRNRYQGYEPGTVDAIAQHHDGPVFVKADGARMREFKAPAENEPRIPASAAVVVPVVSVHVVGKPLTEYWVHRPERVAALTDTGIGDEITAATVATVLTAEAGGLKGVPADATVVPLLTKVDSDEHERAARAIAERTHEYADRIDIPRVVLARFDAVDTV